MLNKCKIPFLLAALATFAWAPASKADDLAPLCDEFGNAATLPNWLRIYQTEGWNANQLQGFDINTTQPGWMRMLPYASTWYQDYRGELAYKNVSGDFVITTYVHDTNRSFSGAPQSQYSLAGIMVRTPRNVTPQTWTPGGENYVFLSLGASTTPGAYWYEVKTTVNSVSTLVTQPANVYQAEIQVVRLGTAIIMLRRSLGGEWVVHRRYSRPDFPAQLQAGLTVYTDWPTCSTYTPFNHNSTVITGGNPDLDARFDFVRYRRPVVPQNLQGQDFTNPSVVSDAQLLSFLGDNANDPQTMPGTLAFGATNYSVNENGGSATINVQRSGGSDGAATVDYATSNNTATAGADFTATTGTLNFAAGETLKSITVPILNDSAVEGNETLTVTLSNATGAALGVPDSLIVTIADDDTLPSLAVNNPRSLPEGNVGSSGSVTFDITLSAASTQNVTVYFQTVNGINNPALAGTDYTAKSGKLTFTPGQTLKRVTVSFIGDSTVELNETFFFDLLGPTNATIFDNRGVGQINNDDGPGISIANASVSEGNPAQGAPGTTAQTFAVTLSAPSTNTVTVDWTTATSTANAADFVAASGTLTFAPGETGKTITVQVNGDTIVEPNETYKVYLSKPTFAFSADPLGIGTIRNDDAAAPLFENDEPSQ